MKTPFKIFLFCLIILPGIMAAQGNHKKHKKMIQERKNVFIKEELQLTKNEEEKLIPLLNEFEEKEDALRHRHKKLIYNFEKNSLNLSENEIKAMNREIAEIFEKKAALKKEYHEKYKKILPPVKVFLLYKAHHDFKRKLIKEFRGRGRHGCFTPNKSEDVSG